MTTFFTSDWHLGETREIMGRPFKDPYLTLLTNHNETVTEDDEVIVVGDVCWSEAPEYLPFVKEFNGHKTLIRGNHDRGITDEEFAPYFERIIPDGDGIVVDCDGLECYVTHYPTQGRADMFNLVGHIHAIWRCQLNMLNVGVDAHHYKPISTDQVKFFYNAICNFYDKDAWATYDPINAQFAGIRGKQSRYFTPQK